MNITQRQQARINELDFQLIEAVATRKMGLRIFRWTENMETAVPTDHPSDFLVYDADLLSWPVAF